MNENSKEFLLKEFAALRTEIEAKLLEKRNNVRYALIASGAIWSWLAINPLEVAKYKWVSLLPFALSFLFWVRSQFISADMNRMGDYIKMVENSFELPGGLGWQHYLALRRRPLKQNWEYLYWILLCIGNLIIGVHLL